MKSAQAPPADAPVALMHVGADKDLDAEATSLRRAATALLIFSIFSMKHLQGWLGLIAAISVLCASTGSIRTRRTKICSGFAAGLAIVTFVACIAAVVAGLPQALSREIRSECVKVPAETFEWGSQAIAAHDPHWHELLAGRHEGHEGHHHHEDEAGEWVMVGHEPDENELDDIVAPERPLGAPPGARPGMGATFGTAPPQSGIHGAYLHKSSSDDPAGGTIIAFFSGRRVLRSVAKMLSPEQEAACNHVAHLVADYGSALILLFALLQFGLFVSAVVVAKRACLLQRAYCQRSCACEPVAAVVVSPLAAEMA